MEELAKIYGIYSRRREEVRSAFLEHAMRFESLDLISIDDERNESDLYGVVFKPDKANYVAELHEGLMRNMQGKAFGECSDQIAGLMFLQELIATAMWKYRIDVGENLKCFAQQFDRLDVLEEKMRLYDIANKGSGFSSR